MNIFLSYSTQDHHYKDEIKTTLSKLERDGKIRLWIDEKKLKAGEKFDTVIETEIKKADMFLLLLSRNFWASDYIQKYELPLILERYRANEALIIPIVLHDTFDLLGYDEVKEINGLPRDRSVMKL
ncbi:MAG: toll/interleukin-1 receptor domain-containing protein [Epsilonproteobacteria bacterium]|nr:toll/interleukin-1 receptor domain-containing protein [Campylobacterota bacterium]